MLKTFIISGWPLFSETVLVMVIHNWLASSFFLSFRIGSKRSRQDTNSQICLVNAPIGLFSFLAGKLKFMLFCSNADLLSLGDRYKIYIEGSAWSVSEKYILACDSMTLVVTPKYYDFYSRVLMPMQHYWPVQDDNKCSSIKFAVDWGNSHRQKVCFLYAFYISVMKFSTLYHNTLPYLSELEHIACKTLSVIWTALLVTLCVIWTQRDIFKDTYINQTTVEWFQHYLFICIFG